MLNLTEPITYTATEKAHLARLLAERDENGNLLTGPVLWKKEDAYDKIDMEIEEE